MAYGEMGNEIGLYIHADIVILTVNGTELKGQLVNGTTPCVICEETNKLFFLSWKEIIQMAIDQGILNKGEDNGQ